MKGPFLLQNMVINADIYNTLPEFLNEKYYSNHKWRFSL